MELAQRSICDLKLDYERLLHNIGLIKCLIKCDNCNLRINDPGVDILHNLFDDPNGWYDIGGGPDGLDVSCFDELYIWYFNKGCDPISIPWLPCICECTQEAIDLATDTVPPPHYQITSWKMAVDIIAKWLGEASQHPDTTNYYDTLKMIDAICDLIKQRIYIEKILTKYVLTVDDCIF